MSTAEFNERPDVLAYRVNRNQERLDWLESWRRDVDKERAERSVEFKDLHEDMVVLQNAVKRMTWALVGFALTVAGSSVGVVLALVSHA
jgi:hypothetical protein